MEKMIEQIKIYREEYTGNRVAMFLKDNKTQKKAHFEDVDEVTIESNDDMNMNKQL